jgi:hypothetical protein
LLCSLHSSLAACLSWARRSRTGWCAR